MFDKVNRTSAELATRVGNLYSQMDGLNLTSKKMTDTSKLATQLSDRLGRMELKF